MMTTITTVRRNALLHAFPLWDAGTLASIFWGFRDLRSRAFTPYFNHWNLCSRTVKIIITLSLQLDRWCCRRVWQRVRRPPSVTWRAPITSSGNSR